ncbi:MAG: DUF3467 domain-containing protein [Patescibacteria group bacterium]|jgi:hypothetical protein
MPNVQQPQPGQQQGQQIQIKLPDDVGKGVHANLMSVMHTKEEFIIDFILVNPAQRQGMVNARVVTSPGHAKRIAKALEENVKKYESTHGTIAEAQAPEVGFTA